MTKADSKPKKKRRPASDKQKRMIGEYSWRGLVKVDLEKISYEKARRHLKKLLEEFRARNKG